MNVLEIKNLTKYYGKTMGIENVSFDIQKGEIFGFIGPNGAGKSTTIRTILGFLHPMGGSVKILGVDCFKEPEKFKNEIGYVPSEINYYDDMKVKDLLAYSEKFYKKDCGRRIKELGDVFEIELDKKIDALSFGNKKKVAIVQAFLHEPKLIILDEPTGGLDPLMQNAFFELLKKENEKGVTIFFSSHILSEVQKVCSRVAIIKEGRILKIKEVEKLRTDKYKKVKVEFKQPEKAASLVLPGKIDNDTNDGTVEFLYNGRIDELVKKLSEYEIENLWMDEPQLEEIFLHYYEKEG